MSKEDDNKAIVGRWFTDFWGKTCNLDIVDELAAPDMLCTTCCTSRVVAAMTSRHS
jgi:hypothetical protein